MKDWSVSETQAFDYARALFQGQLANLMIFIQENEDTLQKMVRNGFLEESDQISEPDLIKQLVTEYQKEIAIRRDIENMHMSNFQTREFKDADNFEFYLENHISPEVALDYRSAETRITKDLEEIWTALQSSLTLREQNAEFIAQLREPTVEVPSVGEVSTADLIDFLNN